MDKTMADTVMDIVDIVLMMIAILVVTIHEIWQSARRRRRKEAEWPKIDLRSLTDAELEGLISKARLGEGTLAAVAYEMHRRGTWPKEAEK